LAIALAIGSVPRQRGSLKTRSNLNQNALGARRGKPSILMIVVSLFSGAMSAYGGRYREDRDEEVNVICAKRLATCGLERIGTCRR